jgi:hypothetical protein
MECVPHHVGMFRSEDPDRIQRVGGIKSSGTRIAVPIDFALQGKGSDHSYSAFEGGDRDGGKMDTQCVAAVYWSFDDAKRAMIALERANFPLEKVSLVTHSVKGQVSDEGALQFGDQTERKAVKGAGVGGLVGALLGAPLLAVPGVGPLLLAGPIATGLTGAIVGGFLGSMIGWGVHDDHVREYEAKVRDGAVLVVVNGDPKHVAAAKRVLDDTAPAELRVHAETSEDDIEP